MRIIFTALSLLAAIVFWPPAARADIKGLACVQSGDTLAVNGQLWHGKCTGGKQVALYGIDAFEPGQTCRRANGGEFLCGQAAASFLQERIKGKTVDCKGSILDERRRLLASCFAGGENLNALMVAQGWALADQRMPATYAALEEKARAERRGAWAMTFDPPWVWRKTKGK